MMAKSQSALSTASGSASASWYTKLRVPRHQPSAPSAARRASAGNPASAVKVGAHDHQPGKARRAQAVARAQDKGRQRGERLAKGPMDPYANPSGAIGNGKNPSGNGAAGGGFRPR